MLVSEKIDLTFYCRPAVGPSKTLIFGKMAFFDNLLWKRVRSIFRNFQFFLFIMWRTIAVNVFVTNTIFFKVDAKKMGCGALAILYNSRR